MNETASRMADSLIFRTLNLSLSMDTKKAKTNEYIRLIADNILQKIFFSGIYIKRCQKIVLNLKSEYIIFISLSRDCNVVAASKCIIPELKSVNCLNPKQCIL